DNLTTLKEENYHVVQQNAAEFLATETHQPLDLIFLDPPFRKNWLAQIVPLLENGWLADTTLVYIEMEKEA
ncbi:RsmD family RNA methyltransferase, partial [Marinomonas arenicola]